MSKELAKKMNISLDFLSRNADKVSHLVKLSEDTKIENDEALDISRDNIKQVKDLHKKIEEKRKDVLKPLRDATTYVNNQCKYYTEKLEDARDVLNSKIVEYSNIAAAQKKAEEEQRRKEAEKRADEKEDVAKKFIRIRKKMYAFLLGGTWIERDGTEKSHPGLDTSEKVNALNRKVEETLPKPEEFGHLSKLRNTLIAEFKANCAIVMSIMNSDADQTVKTQKLNKLRENIIAETNELVVELDVSKEEEIKLEEKKMAQEVKHVTKSIRKTIRFNIVDESAVDRNLLSVDETKVNEFSRVNREKLLKALSEGKQPLSGIEFYVKETVL